MSHTATAIPALPRLPPVARSDHHTVLRALPLPPPVNEALEDFFDEDTRGWIEAHLDKLLAFVGSAALSAALISRLLSGGAPKATVPATTPVPVHAQPVIIAPAPVPAEPIEIAVPPSIAEPETQPVVRAAPHLAKRSTRKIHAKSHPKAHARHAPRVARSTAASAGPFEAAREAYASGDLAGAEKTLRRASLSAAANRVAAVERLVDQAHGALRIHDETSALHAFDAAARADKAAALGSGKISHEIAQKLGLLHVAAALRDRRAGNEAGARHEFEAAHRADPDNARATAELAAPTEEIELQDAIDPE